MILTSGTPRAQDICFAAASMTPQKKNRKKMTPLVPSAYIGPGQDGDYEWMIKQPSYAACLFVMSENFLDSMRPPGKARPGAGTACLRLHALPHTERPRAVGVPTGWSRAARGFPSPSSNELVKRAIDCALSRVAFLLVTYSFDTVIYSCDHKDRNLLGADIFRNTIDPMVLRYISEGLLRITADPHTFVRDMAKIKKQEVEVLFPHAKEIDRFARSFNAKQSLADETIKSLTKKNRELAVKCGEKRKVRVL